jgi:ATP-dependent DNA helicase RecQ
MKQILKQAFGFNDFRPHQEEIIRNILAGRDVVAVMPTGGGKSLCYQLPARVLPGTAVVLSPLISLMKDQVDAARENDLAAAYLNSSQEPAEMAAVYDRLRRGGLHLLYVAPERLASPGFLEALRCVAVSLFAIDEAHCISEWGPDFRPEYLNLGVLRSLFPEVPVAAFTATATLRVQEDIILKTGLRSPFILRASFDRPNLFYRVREKGDASLMVLDYVREHPGRPGIVYRTTRKSVVELAAFLAQHGVEAVPYHAGMETAERTRNQEAFNRDEATVIVATIAFGMGIDKSNVRFVIHADLPKNIESYYQETGRAGRDGEPAECLLFWGRGDIPKIKYFINQIADEEERRIAAAKLDAMVHYAAGRACRRRTLLAYFGEIYPADSCGHCDSCVEPRAEPPLGAEARLVLSAVLRLEERYGASYIADFVSGVPSERIRQRGHEALPGFGAGRSEPAGRWRALIDDLIGREILSREGDPYPVLKLTKRGMAALSTGRVGGAAATVAGVEKASPPQPAAAADPIPPDPPAENDADDGLFEQLRALRRGIAAAHGVPPYIIFSDKTLREMAARLPTDEAGLKSVTGVGDLKFEKYGRTFIAAIAQYREKRPDAAPRRPPVEAPAAERPRPHTVRKREKGDSLKLTRRMLEEGRSLKEIAQSRNLAETTIASHLAELILAGAAVDIDDHVSREKRQLIQRAFKELNTDSLTRVVERLGGEASYDEARLVRAWLKKRPLETA